MTARALVVVGVLVWAGGCGAGEASPAEPSNELAPESQPASERVAAPEPEAVAAPEDERARAIREAEAFVRAQGYADTPPTATGDEIVHEGIEGAIEDRRNTLDPHAVYASGANGEWNVIFRSGGGRDEDRGRMLRLRPGQRPAFVHQDVILSAFVTQPTQ